MRQSFSSLYLQTNQNPKLPSLAHKVLLSSLAWVIMVLLITTIVVVSIIRQTIVFNLTHDLSKIIEKSKASIIHVIATKDIASINEELYPLLDRYSITEISLLDPTGDELTRLTESFPKSINEIENTNNRSTHYAKKLTFPLHKGKKNYGTLVITVANFYFLEMEFRIIALAMLIITLLLVPGIVMGRYFIKKLMTPILQLAVEMAQVALRKDYSIRAVTTPDTWEAQMLINGFNAMINEIEAKDRLMESLVIERTRDLTSALLEAESAQSKAEKANKAKSEFLASMSHEIRTPINGISALTDLVLTTNLDSQQKEDLKSIRTCLIQLRSIIDSILDLSKIEAGKFHIESSVFNIRQAVENPIVLLRQQALGKGILFNYSIDQNIPLFCRGDATRLTQIINNLVGNAIKFTSTNQSITVNIGLINPITGPIFSLLIEVKDTGIGMTDEQLKHVLEPFHQVDTSTSQKYGGTGLGLTIVSKIVTLMRGEMTLKSEKNVGTTVTIKVPINVATFNENQHECEGNVDSVQIHDNTSRSLEGIVLLIEDNEINRTAVTRLLEQSGLSVVSAENGEKGLELFYLFGSFDVIVTDLRMPVMDGYTAARQIRQLEESSESNKNRIPIIALTADLTETVQERCLEAGIDHVVAKPVNVQELLRTIADRMN